MSCIMKRHMTGEQDSRTVGPTNRRRDGGEVSESAGGAGGWRPGVMPTLPWWRQARVGRRSRSDCDRRRGGLEVETAREMRPPSWQVLEPAAGSFDAARRAGSTGAISTRRSRRCGAFLDAARVRGNPPIDAIVDEGRAALQAHLCRMLAPGWRAPGALAGADPATSWEGGGAAGGSGLPVARARAEIIRVLQALFAAPQTRRRQPCRGRTGPARSRS